MLRVFANYHNTALALDDLALFAHGLNGRSYLHTVNLHLSKWLYLLLHVILPLVRS